MSRQCPHIITYTHTKHTHASTFNHVLVHGAHESPQLLEIASKGHVQFLRERVAREGCVQRQVGGCNLHRVEVEVEGIALCSGKNGSKISLHN